MRRHERTADELLSCRGPLAASGRKIRERKIRERKIRERKIRERISARNSLLSSRLKGET